MAYSTWHRRLSHILLRISYGNVAKTVHKVLRCWFLEARSISSQNISELNHVTKLWSSASRGSTAKLNLPHCICVGSGVGEPRGPRPPPPTFWRTYTVWHSAVLSGPFTNPALIMRIFLPKMEIHNSKIPTKIFSINSNIHPKCGETLIVAMETKIAPMADRKLLPSFLKKSKNTPKLAKAQENSNRCHDNHNGAQAWLCKTVQYWHKIHQNAKHFQMRKIHHNSINVENIIWTGLPFTRPLDSDYPAPTA